MKSVKLSESGNVMQMGRVQEAWPYVSEFTYMYKQGINMSKIGTP